jgi:pimeloyl-ACP methyl ester carboxylesterase
MAFIDAAGFRTWYEAAGDGRPLVLLHGGVSDSREWSRQLRRLASSYRVVAWDAPGCGRSEDPPEDIGLGGYADCLAAFIGALGLARPHVAGLSFGGGLAIALYGRYPGIPASLTLISAYAGWRGSLPDDVVEARLAQALRESEMAPAEVVPGWLPGLLTPSAPPELADELRTVMLDVHPAGYRAMARAFAVADLRAELPAIRVPTLVVHGALDERAPLPVAEALHAAIPGSRLAVIEGAGHQVNMEAPEQLNRGLLAFLRTVDASTM